MLAHSTIYRTPATYASFPYICGDANGGQLCVFREAGAATAEAALDNRHTHQDRDSRIMLARRPAGQRDWTRAENVIDSSETGLAVNDPSLTLLRDGNWLLRFARWHLVTLDRRRELTGPVMRHFPATGEVGRMAGNGFLLSNDEGRSWTELPATIDDPQMATACSRNPVIEHIDGSWLLPVYTGYPEKVETAYMIRSWDRGQTWGDWSIIAGQPWVNTPYRAGTSHNETSAIMLNETTMLAVVRADSDFHTEDGAFCSEGGLGELRWTVSHDVGFTWAPVKPLGLFGQPADLLALSDGRLLCTYGYRRPDYGVRATILEFHDDALIPTHELVLRSDATNWDCGYPASVENEDGSISSAYYLHTGNDGLRHIAVSDWTLDEAEPLR